MGNGRLRAPRSAMARKIAGIRSTVESELTMLKNLSSLARPLVACCATVAVAFTLLLQGNAARADKSAYAERDRLFEMEDPMRNPFADGNTLKGMHAAHGIKGDW